MLTDEHEERNVAVIENEEEDSFEAEVCCFMFSVMTWWFRKSMEKSRRSAT